MYIISDIYFNDKLFPSISILQIVWKYTETVPGQTEFILYLH
jgi:hypothetical protein